MQKTKYFKTRVVVDVLSEDTPWDGSLAELHYDITTGPCSGVVSKDFEELDSSRMVEECLHQGTDPEFFGIEDASLIAQVEERMHGVNPKWLDNSIQFPRLLAEIIGVGLSDEQWESLLETMDLGSDELNELFDRAQSEWEKAKSNV